MLRRHFLKTILLALGACLPGSFLFASRKVVKPWPRWISSIIRKISSETPELAADGLTKVFHSVATVSIKGPCKHLPFMADLAVKQARDYFAKHRPKERIWNEDLVVREEFFRGTVEVVATCRGEKIPCANG